MSVHRGDMFKLKCLLNDAEKRAHHEAGHAVARARLGVPFVEVRVVGNEFKVVSGEQHPDFRDVDFSVPEQDNLAQARARKWPGSALPLVWNIMVAAAAGPLAQIQCEERNFPTRLKELVTVGGGADVALLDGYALILACHKHSDDGAAIQAKERLVMDAVQSAGGLVRAEHAWIRRVALGLLQKGRLRQREVAELAQL